MKQAKGKFSPSMDNKQISSVELLQMKQVEEQKISEIRRRLHQKTEEKFVYEDILHLPHPVSRSHLRMSLYDRAAQFSPFAALTGHDQAIKETARITNQRVRLDENIQQVLDEKLQIVKKELKQQPYIMITYFVPDPTKDGGSYETVEGRVRKIDDRNQFILLDTEERIEISEIIELDGEIFTEQFGLIY